LSNSGTSPDTLTSPLVDTLPSGLVVAGAGATSCVGGKVTAVSGGTSVTLTGGTIPAGGSCTVTVPVTATAARSYVNTLPAGILQTNNGSNIAPAVATLVVTPSGTTPPTSGYYFVTYYSNNVPGGPNETVRIINTGETGGNLWAAYYVFDDSQELTECCSCVITPDGINSEDVKTNLTANPLTGKVPARGVIKIIGSATFNPSAVVPTTGLVGFATHIQATSATTYAVTEAALANANLAAGEEALLQNLCSYAVALGSSAGVCTCTPEDHDF